MTRRAPRSSRVLAVGSLILLANASPAAAGETLYNGIVLPDEWPPRIAEVTREPMKVPYLENRPEVVPIDVGRQLFVDDFLIEQTTLTRTYGQPVMHPANPVLRPDRDRPWEVSWANKPCAMVFSDGVWFDPSNRLFKMWYMGGYTRSVAYAVSRDGIAWEKPALDVVRGTNIVLDEKERDSTTVWLDHREQDPSRRCKMLVVTQRRDERGGVDMALYYSPDGLAWGKPVATRWAGGDRSTFFYNPFREKWVYSLRSYGEPLGRARAYAECTDLAEGLEQSKQTARPWTGADRLDPHNPNTALKDVPPELYNLDAVAYESLLIGLFSIWQGDPAQALKVPKEKRNELLLGFSRDGFHWHRPDRRPFVGVNESPGAWNWGNIQSAGGCCLVVGNHLYFYVSGRGEDRATGPCSTGLAVLRRDGFASMDAGPAGGTLTTRLVTFGGRRLFINADVAGGELRAEIFDRDGKAIPPFTRNNCFPVTTDRTLHEVRWFGVDDLAPLAGRPVRLRFHLTAGRLYSFWVSPDESGASRGYVAAGGPGFSEPRDTTGQAAYAAAAALAPPATRPADSPTLPLTRQDSKTLPGQWVCATPYAPFSPRDTAEDFVLDGKMWISNAWRHSTKGSGDELTRDLWNSADGLTWTRVSDSTPYDAYSEMVVYKDKVWAIKGSVWNSAEGVQWNRVLDRTPFGPRGYGEAVVFQDRIWQLGSGADVWWTTDGVQWTRATQAAPYGDRSASAVAVFDGKLWVIAGRTPGANTPVEKGYKDITTHHDVWCSPDGATWTRVLDRAPWAPRMWSVPAVYAGRLWLIGGYDNVNHRNLSDVWTTTDGRNWQRFTSRQQFAPRHEISPYVFDGSLWVVAGNTWPVVNDVWRLTLPEADR